MGEFWTKVPVYLEGGSRLEHLAYAEIDDKKMVITVESEPLMRIVGEHLRMNHIKGVFVGIEYTPAVPEPEKDPWPEIQKAAQNAVAVAEDVRKRLTCVDFTRDEMGYKP